MRSTLRKLAFTVATTALLLVGVEGVARLVAGPAPTRRTLPLAAPSADRLDAFEAEVARRRAEHGDLVPLVADEDMGWTAAPSRVENYRGIPMRFNSLGLRGPELQPRSPGEVRLLTLGDSSVMGLGVAYTDMFSTVAAVRLSEAWGRPVTPVVGAIPGHSSEQSIQVLDRHGAAADPDWVIIAGLWSDIYAGLQPGQSSDPFAVGQVRSGLQQLASYRLLSEFLDPWKHARRVRFIDRAQDIPSHSDQARTPLPRYIQNLETIVAKTEALGARPAFLVLPAPLDLDPLGAPDVVADFRAAMAAVAARHDAPLVYGPAVFEAAGADLGYWFDQVHPDDIGHRALGEALAETLAPYGPPARQ
ncbi:MAG: SGNH/GDSL hydrolase family protein [Alphaproteobacteria bacterium]|nr:SGNH/GDSL hydrolase family protein [Alphaproteobacteria bacterium]